VDAMNRSRLIPVLLLDGQGLVKTKKFRDRVYLGDPRNTVRIFNEKEVHELVLFDINATAQNADIQFELVEEIVTEAFMPIGYGGGVRTVADARRLVNLGIEKIVLSSGAFENPELVNELAGVLGSQSVLVCIDYKKDVFGRVTAWTHNGSRNTKMHPSDAALQFANRGAGEVILNCIDRDGTMSGYDLNLIKEVVGKIDVPVVGCGGSGSLEDASLMLKQTGASAAGAGSMFVFQGKHRAVLITYPDRNELMLGLGQ
jgi:imidazole glycerol-phosphate synthase subunit HisF